MSFRCLLIGGASHVGKSSLAAAWGDRLGWPVISTDRLGRHPGRPWPVGGRPVPPHAVEHYEALSDDALLDANLEHYRAMWPLIETLVAAHLAAPMGRLIIEGSGCWPDNMVGAPFEGATAVWLVASDELITQRIRHESSYESSGVVEKRTIERFMARTRLYNRRLAERLDALGLPLLDVVDGEPVEDTIARCERLMFRF